ncbi:MAG: propanediol utilization protein [marine bacterium B5-7]|nr:MAG: propanediol utilization protein [marine bacterium B5-7]
MSRGYSGIDVDRISVDDVRRGDLTLEDIRIHPETLEHQAQVAEEHGNPQLASNFRRAAELTRFKDDEIMQLYEALRPHRSTVEELQTIADDLESRDAPLNAALFAQAASVYQRRGLARK